MGVALPGLRFSRLLVSYRPLASAGISFFGSSVRPCPVCTRSREKRIAALPRDTVDRKKQSPRTARPPKTAATHSLCKTLPSGVGGIP